MAKKKGKEWRSGASTPAISACVAAGIVHTVHQFPHSDQNFGEEAAHWLGEHKGIAADRIFKTLVLQLHGVKGGMHSESAKVHLAVAIVPVTHKLNVKAAAAALGASKADLADPHDAQRSTGYVPGGMSPLGQRKQLPTVIHESALSYDTIFVSGGRRGWDIELSPTSLVELCDATVADITAA